MPALRVSNGMVITYTGKITPDEIKLKIKSGGAGIVAQWFRSSSAVPAPHEHQV